MIKPHTSLIKQSHLEFHRDYRDSVSSRLPVFYVISMTVKALLRGKKEKKVVIFSCDMSDEKEFGVSVADTVERGCLDHIRKSKNRQIRVWANIAMDTLNKHNPHTHMHANTQLRVILDKSNFMWRHTL